MKNVIKAESIVPDKPVQTAQANLGRHFSHMHKALFYQSGARIKAEDFHSWHALFECIRERHAPCLYPVPLPYT